MIEIVDGIQNLSDKPLIVMYNHKSFFDIFCFSSFMPYDWRAMMKKELLSFPVFGQAVKIVNEILPKIKLDKKIKKEFELSSCGQD